MALLQLSGAARLQVEQALQEAVVQSSQVRLLGTLATCLATSADERSNTPAQALQQVHHVTPLCKPLPPPPVDSEVLDLQSQVAAVSQRVAQLRSTVPNQLAQQLTQHLHSCRPALIPAEGAEGVEPAAVGILAAADDNVPNMHPDASQRDFAGGAHAMHAVAAAAADELEVVPLSPAPAALQSMCTAAVQRMPALRAKLEEALERMDRVVQAIERDADPVSPYNPAMLRVANTDAADTLSPALQQALKSGKVVTRRPVAKDLNPVPYAT